MCNTIVGHMRDNGQNDRMGMLWKKFRSSMELSISIK